MSYIKDISHDEVRSGFLVTTDRKKMWERLLEIWHVFDGICQAGQVHAVDDLFIPVLLQ